MVKSIPILRVRIPQLCLSHMVHLLFCNGQCFFSFQFFYFFYNFQKNIDLDLKIQIWKDGWLQKLCWHFSYDQKEISSLL